MHRDSQLYLKSLPHNRKKLSSRSQNVQTWVNAIVERGCSIETRGQRSGGITNGDGSDAQHNYYLCFQQFILKWKAICICKLNVHRASPIHHVREKVGLSLVCWKAVVVTRMEGCDWNSGGGRWIYVARGMNKIERRLQR